MDKLSKNIKRTDQDVVLGIKNGGREEDACLKQLYKENLRPIMSFILSNNGTADEAKEMLQDAIVVLYEKIKSNEFALQAKLSTYLFSVVKNKWYSRLKQKEKLVHAQPVNDHNVYQMSFNEPSEESKKIALIKSFMLELKDDCKQILVLSIYQKYSMNEIANIMGFKNEQTARNKKSKCLGYFKKLILSNTKAKKVFTHD